MAASTDYDDWFFAGHDDDRDDDSDNPIILEKCITGAEQELWEMLQEDVNFSIFIKNFKRFYDAFVSAFIEEYYWDYHSTYYEYVL